MLSISKWLVVLNFAVSVSVAAWAMAFYFTRIDWTNVGQPPGQLAAREANLKTLLAQAKSAELSWQAQRPLLREREAVRAQYREYYQKENALIYNAPAAEQLHELVLGKDGMPDPKLSMRNVNDRLGKPLLSFGAYAKAYDANLVALKAAGDEFEMLIKKDTELTMELNGGGNIEKGLNQRIQEERLKGIGVLEEYDIVKPLLIKTVGDSEFLRARRRQLEKRVKELEQVSKPQ